MQRRPTLVAVVVVGAGLAATIIATVAMILAAERVAQREGRRVLAAAAEALAGTGAHAGSLAAHLASTPPGSVAGELRLLGEDVAAEAAALSDGRRVALVLDPGSGFVEGAALPEEVDVAALSAARDRGPLVVGPRSAGDRVLLTGLAARFDGSTVPDDTASRRERLTGYVLVAVPLDLGTGLAARITGPSGRAAELPGSGEPGDLGAEDVVLRGGRTWEIALGSPPGASRALPALALAAGLAVTALLGAVVRDLAGRGRAAEEAASLRSHQLALIEEAGARLQQSLDLAELLPAFAVALTTEFGLDAVSVHLTEGDGSLREAFRAGAPLPPGSGGPAPLGRTGGVAAGSRIDLPLRRGWRTVGAVAGRAGRSLDAVEMTALAALVELLAVAVTNADLLHRERETANRLRELDTLKNAFLGTVSHELRTAITAITGFSELLADHWDGFDDDRRRDLAQRIRRNGGSLRALVDDLLDFARLEQQRLSVNPQEIDLGEQIAQVVERLPQVAADHVIDLRLGEGVTAWVDPFAVERMLSNLLSNAVKYSPAGSSVTVVVERRGPWSVLEVSDEGPGIPAEDRERVFSRFYRRDDPVTVATKGAGIGLSILGDFVAASGGNVRISDAPGGGARFVVELPAEAPADADADAGPDPLAGWTEGSGS